MDVMFTTHPKDGPGKYYVVVASAEEWTKVREDLLELQYRTGLHPDSEKLIAGLESWGIG